MGSTRARRWSVLTVLATGFVALASMLMIGSTARAAIVCTVTWDGGGGDGLWDTNTNWDTDSVPGASDNVCSAPGDAIQLTYSSASVNQVELLGTFSVTGSTLTVADGGTTSTIHDLVIDDGVTIDGAAPIELTGVAWLGAGDNSSNTLRGGQKTLVAGAGATIGESLYVGDWSQSGSFVNDGTVTYDAGGFWVGDASLVTNSGTFTATFAGWSVSGTGPNPATFLNGATGTFAAQDDGAFSIESENDGTFNVSNGTTNLYQSGPVGTADDGTYDVSTGASLVVSGGPATDGREFSPSAAVDGAGTFEVGSPGITWNATDSVDNMILNGSTIVGAGAITVDGSLQVPSSMGMQSTVALTTGPASTTTVTGSIGLADSATFTNNGSIALSGTFRMDDTSKVENTSSGTITATGFWGGSLTSYCYSTCIPSTVGLINNGTIHTDSLPSSWWTIDGAGFDNDGVVVVDSGVLSVSAPHSFGGDDGGEYRTTAPGQIVEFAASSRVVTASGKVTGPGTLRVETGTVDWGAGTAIENLEFTGGTITGSPTISSNAQFTGGTFTGPGTPTVGAGATATASNISVTNGAQLFNKGTMNSVGPVNLYDTGTIFTNEGTLNQSGAGSAIWASSGSPQFQNTSTGVVNVSVPLSTSYIGVDTANAGTVNVTAGTLDVRVDNTVADTGTWNAAAGATVWFNNNRLFTGASLGGPGNKITDATITGTVTVTAGTLLPWGGATTVGLGTTTIGPSAKLVQTGPLYVANGTLDNQGTWDWFVGDIYGAGIGQIINQGTWNLKNPGYSVYDGGFWIGGITNTSTGTINKSIASYVSVAGLFQNDGLVNVTGGDLVIQDLDNYDLVTQTLTGGTYRMANGRIMAGGAVVNLDARIELLPGGMWRDVGDSFDAILSLANIEPSGALVIDRGGLATGPIDDEGLLEVRNLNTLTVAALSTHPTSVVRVRDTGSMLMVGSGTVSNDGTITGQGTVVADVVNQGTVKPGNSPGILAVDGDVTMNAPSVTDIEVTGPVPGTGYDRLAATGAVSVDGTLAISTPGPFTPVSGTFTVVTGASVTGTFSSITGYNIGNGYYYAVVYNPASVDLVVTPMPTISINDVTQAEGNSGTTNFTFDVTLSAAFPTNVSVDWASADGTATAGSGDYVAASGSLTFLPGETSKQVTVVVNGDLLNEADESFTVDLSNLVNASFADTQGLGTITNDDPLPTLSIDDVTQDEGNAGTTTYDFTVTLDAPSGRTVTVDWATADGTATAGSGDYVAASGSLTFLPGETSKQVTVNGNGDLLNEGDDAFAVNLSGESNAAVGDGAGTGVLTNDDALPTVSVDDVTHDEGDFGVTTYDFTVSLNTASGRNLTVDWATTNGTATAGSDFVTGGGTLTFVPGETTKTVTVLVVGDTLNEATETFTVDLSNLVNVAVGDTSGLGTITNDDGVPSASINDVTAPEGTGGVHVMSFTVALSNPSGSTVTVDFASGDGTATQPSDYTAVAGTLSFLPGETVRNVQVPITTDDALELDETFMVTLSSPTNAILGTFTGTGTLTNDDNNIYVDSLSDVVDASPGDGVCDTGAGECTLRAAVQESNVLTGGQVIHLQTGAIYQLAIAGANEDLAATGDLDVLDTTSVLGNGATIDGGDLDRIFHTNAPSVSIDSLTIRNGTVTGTYPQNIGAGLLAEGTGSVSLTTVTATANDGYAGAGLTMNATGGQTLTDVVATFNNADSGGGLWMQAPGTVSSSQFDNNTAIQCGAGVMTTADVTITSSTFNANVAQLCGAGLLHTTGTLSVSTSTFTSNDGGLFGGGLVVQAPTTLTSNTVTGNTAEHGGGVLQSIDTMTINGGTISGNTAAGSIDSTGGGLTVGGVTTVNGTTIDANSAVHAGGIHQPRGGLTVNNASITNNTATQFGGGMLVENATLNTSQVTGNSALFGGGVFGLVTGTVTINQSEVANNTATTQGGVVFGGGGAIDQSTVAGNSGNGVHAQGALTIDRSTISGNGLAGINSTSGTASITSSTITANGVGGIRGDFTLTNTIVSDQLTGVSCVGTIVSGGYNHASDASCALTGTGDLEGVTADLGPLAANGGPTRTHLPNATSPVIDTGDPLCVGPDQRNATRPNGLGCDKGSVEV